VESEEGKPVKEHRLSDFKRKDSSSLPTFHSTGGGCGTRREPELEKKKGEGAACSGSMGEAFGLRSFPLSSWTTACQNKSPGVNQRGLSEKRRTYYSSLRRKTRVRGSRGTVNRLREHRGLVLIGGTPSSSAGNVRDM